MVYIMPAKPPILYPSQSKLLKEFGERIQLARLRRKFSSSLVAERAGVTRQTLTKVEHGDPAVTMGTYLRVLSVLGLEKDIAQVAADDVLGKKLQDAGLVTPRRVPKRKSTMSTQALTEPQENSHE